jgi:hypothetical protein
MAMRIRELTLGLIALSSVASVAAAETLTDRVQSRRMTVLQIDQEAGRFQCVEHKRWITVSKAGLSRMGAGDIVRVERNGARLPSLVVLRPAAEELAGFER